MQWLIIKLKLLIKNNIKKKVKSLNLYVITYKFWGFYLNLKSYNERNNLRKIKIRGVNYEIWDFKHLY